MKELWIAILLGGTLLNAGCVLRAGPHGAGIAIAPPLPVVVELADPYYYQSDYHYYHNKDRWYYSRSRGGPWVELPRDRYPREVRYKGKKNDNGKGQKRGHDRD